MKKLQIYPNRSDDRTLSDHHTLFELCVCVCVLGDGEGLWLIIEFGWAPDENSGTIELSQVHTHWRLMFSQHDHCPHFCQSESPFINLINMCLCNALTNVLVEKGTVFMVDVGCRSHNFSSQSNYSRKILSELYYKTPESFFKRHILWLAKMPSVFVRRLLGYFSS